MVLQIIVINVEMKKDDLVADLIELMLDSNKELGGFFDV